MMFTLALVPVLPPPHAHASTLCAADHQRYRHGLEDVYVDYVRDNASSTFHKTFVVSLLPLYSCNCSRSRNPFCPSFLHIQLILVYRTLGPPFLKARWNNKVF